MPFAKITALAAFAGFFGAGGENIDFDKLSKGKIPPAWTAGAHWEVVPEPSAPSRRNVFAQTGAGSGEPPFAIFNKVVCKDGDLSVKFRFRHGTAAGIVWRYQDPANYYLLEFSPEQRNISLVHVLNGRTRVVKTVAHDIRANQWYVAKVVYRDTRVRVSFGNRLLFEAADDSIRQAGKTGLWTHAGTAVLFDDFRIDRKG